MCSLYRRTRYDSNSKYVVPTVGAGSKTVQLWPNESCCKDTSEIPVILGSSCRGDPRNKNKTVHFLEKTCWRSADRGTPRELLGPVAVGSFLRRSMRHHNHSFLCRYPRIVLQLKRLLSQRGVSIRKTKTQGAPKENRNRRRGISLTMKMMFFVA